MNKDDRIHLLETRIVGALELAVLSMSTERVENKTWYLDQIARTLLGPSYDTWVKEYVAEKSPDEPAWNAGVAP